MASGPRAAFIEVVVSIVLVPPSTPFFYVLCYLFFTDHLDTQMLARSRQSTGSNSDEKNTKKKLPAPR